MAKARRNKPTASEQPSTTDPAGESTHHLRVFYRSQPPGGPAPSAIGFHVEEGGTRSPPAPTTPTPAGKGGYLVA